MCAAFKIAIDRQEKELYELGLKQYSAFKAKTITALDKYVGAEGSLNGKQMQDDWFPQVKADVFFSHSHKDLAMAISFAGALTALGLNVFIDSCIWSYSDTLLRAIDGKYCMNEARTQFIYKEINKSTSHVRMMLSTAISMMMDKCEAVFFLNTPNALTTKGSMEETSSLWLYADLGIQP